MRAAAPASSDTVGETSRNNHYEPCCTVLLDPGYRQVMASLPSVFDQDFSRGWVLIGLYVLRERAIVAFDQYRALVTHVLTVTLRLGSFINLLANII
jgi:hypothetical protein